MVFALDVGTRKVAGLIADREGETVRVFDIEVAEHEKRAMLDGAVHDVGRVARVVKKIKEILEERNGIELKKVAIALAGRFLKTIVGESEQDFSDKTEITEEDVEQLEISAIYEAMKELDSEDMFCVGYSVLSYELDGSWMMSLEGHRGKRAKAKVIAAFLPAQVVDAMTSVLNRVGLEIEHMTLEPIAAMEVAVPEEIRLLNIALVDVGAGTSDIAISKDGTIVAYGMVPMAGDEITEAIAKEFLLDFNIAEAIKRNLSIREEFNVRDVLDSEKVIKREEILEVIDPVIDKITDEIVKNIIELNGGKPKAVMVVGGGAKVPGFVEKIAEKIDIPKNRVSLKGVENLPFLQDHTGKLEGSDLVTPVGIAKSALFEKGSVFSKVYVNGKPVRLMGLGGRYTVMQVLMQSGYSFGDIVGKPAPAIVYEMNGEVRSVKGGQLKVEIKVNGEEASTKTIVKHGDRIEVKKIKEEEQRPPKVKDIIGKVLVEYEGKTLEILPPFTVNGEYVDEDYEIKDNDKIRYDKSLKVKRIKEKLRERYKVTVNGKIVYPEIKVKVLKGGVELSDEDEVKVGEVVVAYLMERPKVRDVAVEDRGEFINVKFNGELVRVPLVDYEVLSDGKVLKLEDPIESGMVLEVKKKKLAPIIATLLANLDIDIKSFSRYKIYKNGVEAGFAEFLNDGDEIKFVEEG